MSSKPYYLIFRVYNGDPERDRLYAWSRNKKLVKALLKQRDSSKYDVKKLEREAVDYYYPEGELENGNQLNWLQLKSSSTGETVAFLTTMDEMQNTEKKIQNKFKSIPSLVERADGSSVVLELFHNLKDDWKNPLEFIGFRPIDLDYLFQSDDMIGCATSLDMIEGDIDDAYSAYDDLKHKGAFKSIIGQSMLNDVSTKILYSLESFVKTLKEDL